jgi:PAS domain-containing protein
MAAMAYPAFERTPGPAAGVKAALPREARKPEDNRISTLTQQLLLESYTPSCVICDEKGSILYFIDGVVMTFVNITEQKRTQEALSETLGFLEGIVATVREPLLMLDGNLRVIRANDAFYQTFRVSPGETQNRLIYDLGSRQWNIPALRELLEEVLPKSSIVRDFRVDHDFPGIGRKTMLLNARRVAKQDDQNGAILLVIEDRTDRGKT